MNKGLVVGVILLIIILVAGYLLTRSTPEPEPVVVEETPTEEMAPWPVTATIGSSVEGRDIVAHTFGEGETNILFVGGVHGGYEWNSSLLAYEMIDHFRADRDLLPENISVTIIPDLNPDATFEVTGVDGRFTTANIPDPTTRVATARFNANDVDLNRNFDCKWEPTSSWRGAEVSAGSAPFSEPEAAALRDFVLANDPDAVVFWHSQANNVYASECESGVLPETLALMETYAVPASYGQVPVFDAYPITGDAEGWLASIGIPAVTVELESPRSIEWERNLAGTMATIDLYADNVAR